MRVLFDAFWWSKGPIANRTVMREIVEAWMRVFPQDEVVLAVRGAHQTHQGTPPGTEVVSTRLSPQALVNIFELPRVATKVAADVTITHNFTPMTGRSAVFIHDLMFEDHPKWFTWKERLYFSLMGHSARNADTVLTSSNCEATRIERLHPHTQRVVAVGLAPSHQLATARPQRPRGVPPVEQFHLSVGRLNERKNLATVIEAALKSSSITPDNPLIIVGTSEYSGLGPSLPRGTSEAIAAGSIVFLGYATDSELRWLYENARSLVFMSRDEGFGLPVAEARLFGLPVISSDIPIMREVAGPGAVHVGVDDVTGLAAALDASTPPTRRLAPELSDLSLAWNGVATRLRAAVVAAGSIS